jgi:hypothetical protein
LTESTQSDEYFEYLGNRFYSRNELGCESKDQVGSFDEKNMSQKIACKCTGAFKTVLRNRAILPRFRFRFRVPNFFVHGSGSGSGSGSSSYPQILSYFFYKISCRLPLFWFLLSPASCMCRPMSCQSRFSLIFFL